MRKLADGGCASSSSCSEKQLQQPLIKGSWSNQEDQKLIDYLQKHGRHRCWRSLPHAAGLRRSGKSCRLRWLNYLRPGIKRGGFGEDEEDLIIRLHALLGNRWSLIAGRLPGRTATEVKNYWNSHIRKKLIEMGHDPNNLHHFKGSTLRNHHHHGTKLEDDTNHNKDNNNETCNSKKVDNNHSHDNNVIDNYDIDEQRVLDSTSHPKCNLIDTGPTMKPIFTYARRLK